MKLVVLTWWVLTAVVVEPTGETGRVQWVFSDGELCDALAESLLEDKAGWPDLVAAGCEQVETGDVPEDAILEEERP